TMAHSLELRIPFVDRVVDNLAAEIPVDLRISHGTIKYILRKAVEDILPDHALHRKKLAFPVPIRFWLKDAMYDWAKQIITDSQTDQYFNKDYFLKLLDDHRAAVRDNSRKLWTVLTVMMWHKIYVESDLLMYSPEANAVAEQVEEF
ncbi:asparagine synthase, partial [Lactiplantibacillus pentosus]|uniref:asparagine synthase-related protein n=1 Tax=Lactiplantibacillus pentosus TaxID=1589 RepID=UPI003140AE11